MKNEKNPLRDKSYQFALKVVLTTKEIRKNFKEYDLSKQFLRSGTSIGANIEEGIAAFSDKDFHFKFSIAYKEARETHFWIRLLRDSSYLDKEASENLLADLTEILKILGAILKTMRNKLDKKK